MSEAVRAGTYTALGWRWMRVAGSRVAYLVPAQP